MNPFQSLPDYELFIYRLPYLYPLLRRSTLVVVRLGPVTVVVRGEIELSQGIRIVVREQITFEAGTGEIFDYGYEVWQGATQLYWYDSQPHPNNPKLASTHPHHKHNKHIKHNRIPAPGLSFAEPNLPFLINEIVQTMLT
jgi:Family of unknown function (DUF6516)